MSPDAAHGGRRHTAMHAPRCTLAFLAVTCRRRAGGAAVLAACWLVVVLLGCADATISTPRYMGLTGRHADLRPPLLTRCSPLPFRPVLVVTTQRRDAPTARRRLRVFSLGGAGAGPCGRMRGRCRPRTRPLRWRGPGHRRHRHGHRLEQPGLQRQGRDGNRHSGALLSATEQQRQGGPLQGRWGLLHTGRRQACALRVSAPGRRPLPCST